MGIQKKLFSLACLFLGLSHVGCAATTPTQSLSIVTPTVGWSSPTVSLGLASIVTAQSGAKESQKWVANGGVAPYKWSITSGTLPVGLTLSADGTVSGTIQSAAAAIGGYTMTVIDSANTRQAQMVLYRIAAAPLAISTPSLSAAQSGTAYTASLQASGGTPAYTWSIKGGSLPAGLSLAGTSGVISGKPTTAGTSTFTVGVTDSSSPSQAQSVTASITVAAAPQTSASGTTWYIRTDGGTRYSANNPDGQCDGKGDTAYPGKGVNMHCGFNDYRYLWDDQHTYGVTKWVIAGGDTVILRKNTAGWRVGFAQGASSSDVWCFGGNGGQACTNPNIPAGTAKQHTRILGENFGSCSAKSSMTKVFGGFGLGAVMNLGGAQFVDVQCIEVTDNSNCVTHGDPRLPRDCQRYSLPTDDFASDGLTTDTNTHDLLLQDMWIHGLTDRGIIGPIGGVVTANRIDIDKNGMAGWDFDAGNGQASVNSSLIFKNSTIEWSGCNEEFPIVSTVPVTSCYSQSTGGYGDGIGTPAGMGMNVLIDHSIFRYNTQDGEDFGHIDSPLQNGQYSTISITNSQSYGNSGQQFKWGPAFSSIYFTDNFAEANCARMTAAFPGAPATYNANLADFCRAGDALSFNFIQGSQALFANNTIVTVAPTTFDMKCEDPTSCSKSVFTLSNNIVMAYSDPLYEYNGNNAPASYCGQNCNDSTLPIGTINRYNNVYFGLRDCPAGIAVGATGGTISGETCQNPYFVGEPTSFASEASLDNFNYVLSSSSPITQAGKAVNGLTLDAVGAKFGIPPSIGALQYVSGAAAVKAVTN